MVAGNLTVGEVIIDCHNASKKMFSSVHEQNFSSSEIVLCLGIK